ncbi:MAG: hypothetical protein PHP03_01720 [Candidatus Pacebacteria bacterium]|nr:hypothetical protein [Candidatus Paceibacterota bacterium]
MKKIMIAILIAVVVSSVVAVVVGAESDRSIELLVGDSSCDKTTPNTKFTSARLLSRADEKKSVWGLEIANLNFSGDVTPDENHDDVADTNLGYASVETQHIGFVYGYVSNQNEHSGFGFHAFVGMGLIFLNINSSEVDICPAMPLSQSMGFGTSFSLGADYSFMVGNHSIVISWEACCSVGNDLYAQKKGVDSGFNWWPSTLGGWSVRYGF